MGDSKPLIITDFAGATRPLNSKGNSFDTIQAAIDDMDVAGWVYVPPGTYTEAVDIVGKNNLMLYGAGWGMTKITYAGNDHTLNIDNSDDVVIRDIRIDQTSTGNTVNAIRVDDSQRLKIQNVYIGDADQYGIEFKDALSADCEIDSCYITGTDGTGIFEYQNYGNGLKIINNVIKSCAGGIYIASQNCLITGNTVESCTMDGIGVADTHHAIITNNHCIGNSISGIIFDNNIEYSIIANNKCYNNGSRGILAASTNINYNVIEGNICRDNTSDGIKVQGSAGNLADYNTLNGNVCEGNGGKGIYIFGDKGNAHDYANKNIVVGNQLYNNTGTNLDDDGTLTEKGHNITA